MNNKLPNLLSNIIAEAKSYNTFEEIEKLVQAGSDLSMIPIQPLYVSLLAVSTDQLAKVIPRLSKEQRKTLLDLDLWQKDQVDVNSFETWIEAYTKVEDTKLTENFVDSEDFLIYLRSRVNIYTFDVEDPEYPDHDYYFLTEDHQLLIEYSPEYKYPNELKYLIKNLYSKLGVENAYTMLFKIINESYSLMEETAYQEKKERLRDFGFQDYYEVLEKLHTFLTHRQVEKFIFSKKSMTPEIDKSLLNQSLHSSTLVSFDSEMENIINELRKVNDPKRLEFLHFNFIRLVNSTITLKNALKSGRVQLTQIGELTKTYLELGLEKTITLKNYSEEDILFDSFDFFDLYQIGASLIKIEKDKLFKAIKNSPFETEDYEYFLGAWWCSFLENSEKDLPKVKSFGVALHPKKINNLQIYSHWKKEVDLFTSMIPFINTFFKSFIALKDEGKLHDDFYLNYEVENIDFEAIVISSFVNFALGNYSSKNVNKMGVSISELKSFFSKFFTVNKGEYILLPLSSKEIKSQIEAFLKTFGFENIIGMDLYLYGIISEHLSGYEFETLEDEDYKHIGGPILLNYTAN